MAALYIEVFQQVNRDAGTVFLPMAPATPIQTMTISVVASSVQSSAIAAEGGYVRLCADEAVIWSHGENPDATSSEQYLPSGIPEWRYVTPGSRIAARTA